MKIRILLIAILSVVLQNVQGQNANRKEKNINTKLTIQLKNGETKTYLNSEIDSIVKIGDFGVKVYLKSTPKKSVDYLASQWKSITYPEKTSKTENTSGNVNRNIVDTEAHRYAYRLEYPRLNLAKNMRVIYHEYELNGKMYPNLNIEWDNDLRSNHWTAYYMCAANSVDNHFSRPSKFLEDPKLDSKYRTHEEEFKGTGFDKGHLCPNNDKQVTKIQQKQTFYLSNIQPQYHNHNTMIWKNLEEFVRKYLNVDDFRDTLFVVRGATIDKKNIISEENLEYHIGEEVTKGVVVKKLCKLPIARYFYMAFLCKKGDKWKAVAFITKHTKSKKYCKGKKHWGDYAITIDKLEELTGIDFFCNLDDKLEEEVESKAITKEDWPMLEVTDGKKYGWDLEAPWPTDIK